MVNVLVNAYAVSPTKGSEPGVGWNWAVNLARYCNVYVITEGEWQQDILDAVGRLPQRINLHFYFNPVSDKIRKMCWHQGDWRFYYYYRKWQERTLDIAKKIIAEHPIDIVHQLNMIGFREPGFLWKIADKPFVWGPVGGMELMPTGYLEGEPTIQRLKVHLKNVINNWQRKRESRVLSAIESAKAIFAATKGVYDVLHDYHHADVTLMNETGCYVSPVREPTTIRDNNSFDILWVGKFDYRKQLGLAIRIIAKLRQTNRRVNFHIVGKGSDNEEYKYRQLANHLNLTNAITWHGSMPHNEVLELMTKCDLFLFTSIMEGTPHVVLEAIQNSLPIVCFDACGQAGVVNDKIGIKIPLSNTSQSIKDFTMAIERLINDPTSLAKMRNNCQERQVELSWDSKARQMVEIYNKVLSDERTRHQY